MNNHINFYNNCNKNCNTQNIFLSLFTEWHVNATIMCMFWNRISSISSEIRQTSNLITGNMPFLRHALTHSLITHGIQKGSEGHQRIYLLLGDVGENLGNLVYF